MIMAAAVVGGWKTRALLMLTVAAAGLLLLGIWRREADATVLAIAVAVVAGLAWTGMSVPATVVRVVGPAG
jgi:hypothetical protein